MSQRRTETSNVQLSSSGRSEKQNCTRNPAEVWREADTDCALHAEFHCGFKTHLHRIHCYNLDHVKQFYFFHPIQHFTWGLYALQLKQQLVMQNFTLKGFKKLQTYLDSYVAIQLSFLLQKTNKIKLHLLISL